MQRGGVAAARSGRIRAAWIALGVSLGCQSALPPDGSLAPEGEKTTRAPTAPIQYVGPEGRSVSDSESALEDRLGTIQARLEALGIGIMDFWQQHGLDEERGGIHGFHDRKGAPKLDANKGLIQQARHLWSFSTWYMRREKTPGVKAIAESIYEFLTRHFLDRDGEFFYSVSRDGKTVVDDKKLLYAQSFAIYGLAAYAEAFGDVKATDLALACFDSIDRRAHDAEHLGYDQSRDPGWLQPGAAKGTNTHIHLLESFTALYRLRPEERVKARVEELVKVIATRIVQSSHYAHQEFYADWKPHARPVVSYGHDLETTWLLMDALAALGNSEDALVAEVALLLGKHSAQRGYDAQRGGFFEEGVPDGAVTQREKIWWVQAEALPGLWWLYRLSKDTDYLDRLEGTLDWIEKHQVDAEHGEWYWGVNPDGSIGPRGDHKGEEWKASYHALRAAVFTADWIDDTLTRPTAAPRERSAPAQGVDSIARR